MLDNDDSLISPHVVVVVVGLQILTVTVCFLWKSTWKCQLIMGRIVVQLFPKFSFRVLTPVKEVAVSSSVDWVPFRLLCYSWLW